MKPSSAPTRARGISPAVVEGEPVTGYRSPVTLSLRSGKDRPVRLGHPWIFSGAIRDLDRCLEPGAAVRVVAADGSFLGAGYVNPRCDIAVRLLTRADEPLDAAWVRRRVADAAALRRRLVPGDTTAYRLLNGEGDALPGVLVDRYGDVLVLQCLTAGAERLKPWVVDALIAECTPQTVIERSAGSVRSAEGLAPCAATLFGDPPGEVVVRENGLALGIDPQAGQKTGHFCDQRPNRALVRALAGGQRVLDAFAHTGGFAVHAGAGDAMQVVAVDSSARALDAARRNWERNGLDAGRFEAVHRDVGRFLRERAECFDLLVLDPPALVRHRGDLERGARAYKDLQLWACRRAAPGALLCAFSCSAHVGAELFRKILCGAAADARREVQLLQTLGAGPDHPVAAGHPEGDYLHGVLVRLR